MNAAWKSGRLPHQDLSDHGYVEVRAMVTKLAKVIEVWLPIHNAVALAIEDVKKGEQDGERTIDDQRHVPRPGQDT